MFGTAYQDRQADNVITAKELGFNNFEVLQMTTKNAAEVVQLSGELNPWKEAPLGVVEVGAWGDVIIVDGNPLEDINAIKKDNVKLVVQGGTVHKNTL
ncbi:amidohydrolase family protein [Vibrio hangzhouensis]|nr:amidohydrolase family protein [Vibrio hangzhouensis]